MYGLMIIRLSYIASQYQVWVQEGSPDIPLPRNFLQLHLGVPKEFPGQRGSAILPVSSGSALGTVLKETCLEKL